MAWNSTGEFAGLQITDQFGAYYFDTLPADSYRIASSAEGYSPATNEPVEVLLGSTISANFTMGPEATISGTAALAADGSLLEGALIEARGAATGVVATTHADAQGRYRLPELPADQYVVIASAPAYIPATSQQIDLAAGTAYEGVDFSLELGGSIQGRIVAPDGSPVEAATVLISLDTPRAQVAETDASGQFAAAGLPTGRYQVRAYSSGLAQDSLVLVDVTQGQVVSLADSQMDQRLSRA